MEMLNQTIKYYNKFVSSYNYDREYDVITFVNVKTNLFYEIQIYDNKLYMVTVTDDLTGDELYVKYLTIYDIIKLLK